MSLDLVQKIDDDDVYEDLPQFMLNALSNPNTQDVLCDPSGVVRVHALGKYTMVGYLDYFTRMRFLRKASKPRYFDERHPILRKILPNNERLEAVYDTVSPDGVMFVIRVPGPIITLQQMVERGSMNNEQCDYLELVAGKKNIVASGEAGSGKTTILRAIAESPGVKSQRSISIEGDPEMQKPENGARLIDIEEDSETVLVPFMRVLRSTLRLKPKLIIVAEILDGNHAFAYVHATRGHKGMTTIHAGEPIIAPQAIRELGKLVGGIPTHDVARACSVVVQVEETGDGGRRVSEIVTIGVKNEEFVGKRVA